MRRKSWGLGGYNRADGIDGEVQVHYGYPPKDVSALDYTPDLSCCTKEEIRRWKAARRYAEKKKLPTALQLAESLKNFKPTVPISYIVASRRAARNR